MVDSYHIPNPFFIRPLFFLSKAGTWCSETESQLSNRTPRSKPECPFRNGIPITKRNAQFRNRMPITERNVLFNPGMQKSCQSNLPHRPKQRYFTQNRLNLPLARADHVCPWEAMYACGKQVFSRNLLKTQRKEVRAMALEEIKSWWDSTSPTQKKQAKRPLRNFNPALLAASWDDLDEDTQDHLILLLM